MTIEISSVQDKSIDNLIELYRNGHVLNSNYLNSINLPSVKKLAYTDQCSGTATLDKSDTTLDPSGYSDHPTPLLLAVGQKFKPSSRCLNSVTIRLQRELDADAYIEIRKTTTTGDKLPDGDPQTTGGRIAYATIPYNSIPMSPGDVTVMLNVLLDDFDLTNGVWIVVCMYNYDPNCVGTYCTDSYFTIKGGGSYTADQYVARKNGTNTWTKSASNIYFKTFKQNLAVTTGTISGNVKDSSNNNLQDAMVTDGTRNTNTDINGNYSILNVPVGTYNVTASKTGYISSTQPNKTVTAGQTTTANFILSPSSGGTYKKCINDVCSEIPKTGSEIDECTTVGQTCIPSGEDIGNTGIIIVGLLVASGVILYMSRPKRNK